MTREEAIRPELGEELQLPGLEDPTRGPGSRGGQWPYQHVDFAPLLKYARLQLDDMEAPDEEVGKLLGRSRRSIIRYRADGTLPRCAVERIANHLQRTPWDFYPDWYK